MSSTNNIIVNADDFNNSVDVMNEVSTTLFETKKELEGISNSITINKEELENKLEILDKYFIKLETIQRQVVGDRSVDIKFESYLKKIENIYDSSIAKFEKNLQLHNKNIDDKILNAEKNFIKASSDIKEDVNSCVEQKIKVIDNLSMSVNVNNFSKHASEFKNSANSLLSAVNVTNETLKEVQNLRKKGVAYFVSGVAFGAIVISILWWSKGFLGI